MAQQSATEKARGWTYKRQQLGGAAKDAATALREVVGVYSSHPSAPLSLHARCKKLDAGAFRALDALRLPAMRGSIHLLPRETAHLPFRAVPERPVTAASRLKYFGLTERRFETLKQKVLAAAGEPMTSTELKKATGAGDKLSPVTGALGRMGLLMRVGADGLRSNQLRYVVAEIPEADPDEALAWLATEYLRAFGPARVEDFAWWTGAPTPRAKRAVATVETEELDGGLLLPAADHAGFARARPPRGKVDLLPKWDCYTMGYPKDGRDRFAHPDVVDRCYDFRGDGLPVILVEGRAAGTWSLRPGKKVDFELDLFEPLGEKLKKALDQRLDAVRAFLS